MSLPSICPALPSGRAVELFVSSPSALKRCHPHDHEPTPLFRRPSLRRRRQCRASAARGSARAGRRPGPAEGRDYTKLEPPQPPGAAGKIEVLEFFSYACPHCSAFEPTVEAWEKTLPADVAFKRVPVPFLMNAENFMHTYYALETIGAVNAVQLKIFRAIHIDRVRLETAENMAEFVVKNGVDATKFLAAFKSFSVATSVTKAKKMMADYKIEACRRWSSRAASSPRRRSPAAASGRSRSSTAWRSACASPDATPGPAGRRYDRAMLESLPAPAKTVALLAASNVFMTFAWYGHLKTSSSAPGNRGADQLGHRPLRISAPGARQPDRLQSGMTLAQLKITRR